MCNCNNIKTEMKNGGYRPKIDRGNKEEELVLPQLSSSTIVFPLGGVEEPGL